MGDMQQQAMPEEEEILAEEDIDGLHPHTLDQHNPWFITTVVSSVFSLIASNGWYAVGFFVFLMFLWRMFSPKIGAWWEKREKEIEAAEYHKDPDKFLDRERAIDDARRRLQEQYSQRSAEWAEQNAQKQREKEEKKRQELIEDWERHQRGEGYRSKSRLNATATPTVPAASTSSASGVNKSKKSTLRPDYNPMTGDIDGGGSCRWRPDRRGPSGGG